MNLRTSFRKMREEDKPAIYEICKLIPWRGDYLRVCLDTWSKDPDKLLIVMLLDNEVVGFHCFTVLDNGNTIWSEATRIHPNHRGKGILKEFINHRMKFIQEKGISHISRVRWAKVIEDDTVSDAKLLHTVWYQFGIRRGKLDVIKKLRNITESIRNDKVKPIYKVDHKQIHEHVSKFFPSRELISMFYVAWDSTLSNFKLLEDGRFRPLFDSVEYWMGGWREAGGSYGFGKSFSISCLAPVDSGPYYVVTIHTKDWKQFYYHLLHHVQIFEQQQQKGGDVTTLLFINCDVELQSRLNQQLFTEKPTQSSHDGFYEDMVGIFERENIPPAKM